ncbi:MAG: rhodanese-like domain-containing protein [Candidatus Zixiibacteriota bacterium]|nr:MAG: rhodanese-like domain-containing protein [candidate division Zixibacteria bacterium]
MKTLTTEELLKQMDSGPVALFDVRGDVDYDKGHIPGAKSAPLGSLVFRVVGVMNPDSQVVVYSGGKECSLAAEAVKRLENLRLFNVYAYEEGYDGWKAAGQPVAISPLARPYTWGPAVECRNPIVDRERAYNGAFKTTSENVEGAGG